MPETSALRVVHTLKYSGSQAGNRRRAVPERPVQTSRDLFPRTRGGQIGGTRGRRMVDEDFHRDAIL